MTNQRGAAHDVALRGATPQRPNDPRSHHAQLRVIDLGSNSIRLVICEVKDDRRETYTNKDFKSLINDKVMAGLSATVVDARSPRRASTGPSTCSKGPREALAVLRLQKARGVRHRRAAQRLELQPGRSRDRGAHRAAHIPAFRARRSSLGIRRSHLRSSGRSPEPWWISAADRPSSRASEDPRLRQRQLGARVALVVRALRARHPARRPRDARHRATRCATIWTSCRTLRRTERTPCAASAAARAPPPRCCNKPQARQPGPNHDARRYSCDTEVVPYRPRRIAHAALSLCRARAYLVPGASFSMLFDAFGAQRLEICKYGVREGYLIERMLL